MIFVSSLAATAIMLGVVGYVVSLVLKPKPEKAKAFIKRGTMPPPQENVTAERQEAQAKGKRRRSILEEED
jgi:hypothetical protein